MSEPLLLQVLEAGVLTLTLNRPEVMNAFGGTMREDLRDALAAAETNPQVRCVVITGTGKAFCAGGDVASMARLQEAGDTTEIGHRMAVAAEVIGLIRRMAKPVIASVNGAAAGAGMNLALACDWRYAARSARFAESFIKIGLIPDWGGHFLLTELVGPARAMELIMTGERIDAETALRFGIVNAVFEDTDLTSQVKTRAEALAAAPTEAIAAIKQGVRRALGGSLTDTLGWESTTQRALFLSTDAREGMRAFVEKRPARFGQSDPH